MKKLKLSVETGQVQGQSLSMDNIQNWHWNGKDKFASY